MIPRVQGALVIHCPDMGSIPSEPHIVSGIVELQQFGDNAPQFIAPQ